MNDVQRERLQERVAPGHVCSPHNGACALPHYIANTTVARYLAQWPEPSVARARYETLLDEREWAIGGLDADDAS